MKTKIVGLILLVLAMALLACTAVTAQPQTYHWLLQTGEDGYILCAGGRWDVEVNGADSIHVVCVVTAEESK
jgi:hypothetical protein